MARTLATVQAELALWETAYSAVTKGETFSMRGRTLTRVNADTCRQHITALTREEKRLLTRQQGGNGSHSLATFGD